MKELENPNLICGYFGKLPEFGDFIKYNSGNDEILVIDKWIQEGLSLAELKPKNEREKIYRKSLPFRFFYPFAGTDKLIAGIIFPSQDKSGRNFPFLMFLNFYKSIFHHVPFCFLPLILNEHLNIFESIFNDSAFRSSQSILNERINRIHTYLDIKQAEESYNIFINISLQRDFWQRIYRDCGKERKYYLVENIFEPDINYGTHILKLNFSSDDQNNALDICFLLDLMAISKSDIFIPALFWTKNNDNKILLYLFPSKPTPINYLDIIYTNNRSDMILKMDEKTESVENSSKIKNLLDKEGISLKELIQILKH